MTEQEKRKQIIEGLEHCLSYQCDECQEKNSSGYPWDCQRYDELVQEALVLLKAQEPRVLSYENAMLNLNQEVVWLEIKGDPIIEPIILTFTTKEYSHVFSIGFGDDEGFLKLIADKCGKEWRPWTSRPTDEQRKMVKWK